MLKSFKRFVRYKAGCIFERNHCNPISKKCSPHKTIKLTGTQGSPAAERVHIVLPLYYMEYLPEYMRGTEE
ncbi:hypothetical protein GCM10007932_44050 [Vibrio penaeicida]|uniref:Uncharacterized protein n=1 Tax=Vibrio penaeicida TaxID=104609 RepID=A0AAV5NWU2_9VIBR|nr:hypothetical protein GCM10007932_44050 [Vibrio penaeicida]